jgi:hypothetical protein
VTLQNPLSLFFVIFLFLLATAVQKTCCGQKEGMAENNGESMAFPGKTMNRKEEN